MSSAFSERDPVSKTKVESDWGPGTHLWTSNPCVHMHTYSHKECTTDSAAHTQRHTDQQRHKHMHKKKIHWTLVLSKDLEFNTFFSSVSSFKSPDTCFLCHCRAAIWIPPPLASMFYNISCDFPHRVLEWLRNPAEQPYCGANPMRLSQQLPGSDTDVRSRAEYLLFPLITHCDACLQNLQFLPGYTLHWITCLKQSLMWINTAIDISKIMFY